MSNEKFEVGEMVTFILRGKVARAEVIELHPRKGVRISYESSSVRGRSWSMSLHRPWRKPEQLTKVSREPDELSPGAAIGMMARALRESRLGLLTDVDKEAGKGDSSSAHQENQ